MQSFYSHGKLLISAEYVVLDGAKALAIPTKKGQLMEVETIERPVIMWSSYLYDESIWQQVELSINRNARGDMDFKFIDDSPFTIRLQQIFQALSQLNPSLFTTSTGFNIRTQLEFPSNWGLGSSSTLINNLAQWADVDAFDLLELTFGGSGYDIACAQAEGPIFYQINDTHRKIETISFDPIFKDQLHFVFLNQKKDSREAIDQYRNQNIHSTNIEEFTALTNALHTANDLKTFMELMDTHESKLSTLLNQPTVKDQLFEDFEGSIKSLGGWGGDFILVASEQSPLAYFEGKGFPTVIKFSDMIL